MVYGERLYFSNDLFVIVGITRKDVQSEFKNLF